MLEINSQKRCLSAAMSNYTSFSALNEEKRQIELFSTHLVRCAGSQNSSHAHCRQCETCQLNYVLSHVSEWLGRIGHQSKRQFILGLIRRIHKVEIIRQISILMRPLLSKDAQYSRSRYKPALSTDSMTVGGDRSVSKSDWQSVYSEVFSWFQTATPFSKMNFLYAVLQQCEAFLLQDVERLCHVLLSTETRSRSAVSSKVRRDIIEDTDTADDEVDNYQMEDYPQDVNTFLRSLKIDSNLINIDSNLKSEFEIRSLDPSENKQDEENSVEERLSQIVARGQAISEHDSVISDDADFYWTSPEHSDNEDDENARRYNVISPYWGKGYSGVKKRIDFVRYLPVNLSKYILNLLDDKSLKQCFDVNEHWKKIAQEVMNEAIVNQQIAEGVMLLQGVSANPVNPCYAHDVDVPIPNLYRNSTRVKYLTDPPDFEKTIKEMHQQAIQLSKQETKAGKQSGRSKSNSPSRRGNAPRSDKANRGRSPPKSNEKKSNKKKKGRTGTPIAVGSKEIYRSECNFEVAYRNVSTRNVIIEERNVYCGPYNVLVLLEGPPMNKPNPSRIVHTDGGHLVAMSDSDRSVIFLDIENRYVPKVKITGHAGSIRCVVLVEKRGFVLTGSYDTSVRRWSLHSGQCQKIYKGHMGTINALHAGTQRGFISGSTDCTAKVWDFERNECLHSLKHRNSVTAVAMSDTIFVTGESSGAVTVWNAKTAFIIKVLHGHSSEITSICFDRYHILTGSKDCYVLMWSAIGTHTACLCSLRHPRAVLCLQFRYLRVITGCEDGRIRIWNVLNRKCCRIMRGNSRSDPILHLIAIGNRLTINTPTNILALNFEPVQLNYQLSNDGMSPLVRFGSYTHAPIRRQPYSYVRAQRMRLSGSADARVVRSAGERQSCIDKSMDQSHLDMIDCQTNYLDFDGARCHSELCHSKLPRSQSSAALLQRSKSRGESAPSAINQAKPGSSLSFVEPGSKETVAVNDATIMSDQLAPSLKSVFKSVEEPGGEPRRRLSYGFEGPVDIDQTVSLAEMKKLFRSQLRLSSVEASLNQPEFIKKTISVLQDSAPKARTVEDVEKLNEAKPLFETNSRSAEPRLVKLERPSSGPSRLDPRRKDNVRDIIELAQYGGISLAKIDQMKEGHAFIERKKAEKKKSTSESPAQKSVIKTGFESVALSPDPLYANHCSRNTRTTIPAGSHTRPLSAAVPLTTDKRQPRNNSAGPGSRPASGLSVVSEKLQSKHQAVITPMLMYPKDFLSGLKAKKAAFDERMRKQQAVPVSSASDTLVLRTFQQDLDYIKRVESIYIENKQKKVQQDEKDRKARWLQMAKGQDQNQTVIKRPKTAV